MQRRVIFQETWDKRCTNAVLQHVGSFLKQVTAIVRSPASTPSVFFLKEEVASGSCARNLLDLVLLVVLI